MPTKTWRDRRAACICRRRLLTLLGVPILIAGTLIHQKLGSRQLTATLNSMACGGRSAPVWALAGVFIMFGGFAVSVEQPIHRWVCGSINIGTLLAVAWFLRVPALHVPAQVYIWRRWSSSAGRSISTLDGSIARPACRKARSRLCGLFVLQALCAEALIRLHRRIDARYYAVGSAVSTVLAGILIAPFALRDPGITALVPWHGGTHLVRREYALGDCSG